MLQGNQERYVGIMTFTPLSERSYFQKIGKIGENYDIHVFAFSPEQIKWSLGKVIGFHFSRDKNKWVRGIFPLPNLVYDRCFFHSKDKYTRYRIAVNRLRAHKQVQFLGNGLKGKWDVYQSLRRDPYFHPHLPKTDLYQNTRATTARLNQDGELFLKPRAGSHGKGTCRITKIDPTEYTVSGRDHRNQMIQRTFSDELTLRRWLKQFTSTRKYLVQQYLQLTSKESTAYDVRVLMQKNRNGQWALTGMGVRQGKPGSITSNLHGGGDAERANVFLCDQFGAERAEQIIEQLRELSFRIPPALEQSHGRLAELGVDLGVDKEGHIWIIEVNSKPGRTIFSRMSDNKATISSVNNLIHYARYLLDRRVNR